MEQRSEPGCCGGPTSRPDERQTWVRSAMGWAILLLSCALAYLAHTVSGFIWPVVALAAWFGAYQTVYARGCGFAGSGDATQESRPPDRLPAGARATRRRMGTAFLVFALVPAAVATWGWPVLWPVAFLAGWFGASFLVASLTGYPGCPEVGAIPSLVLRRDIPTRCRPMERIDHLRERAA